MTSPAFVLPWGRPARNVVHALRAMNRAEPGLNAHCERVARLADALGQRLGLGDSERDALWMAARLHDLGKLALPRALFRRRGPQSPEDWAALRSHPALGERMAARLIGPQPLVLAAIRHHHEKWDGTGYPDRRAGLSVPQLARVLAVANTYDALQCQRAYKPAWSPQAARAEVLRGQGSHFDPVVVAAFE